MHSSLFTSATLPIKILNSSLRLSRVTVASTRPKPPCGGAPIPRRASPRLLLHPAPSPAMPTPPRRAVPGPRRRAPCLVPCRVEVLPTPPFRHQKVVATVDAGAAATLGLSSRHHEIQSGLTRASSRSIPSSDVASACCKHMFKVLHVFYMHVASISRGCCKSKSRCCICYNGYTVCCKHLFQMFQLFQTNVARVFI
jgi:hypothetical protein